MSKTLNVDRGADSQRRLVMPFFRVILSRHESNPEWQIVSNPRWDCFTKAQSAILENMANEYAEYKNCGCMSRMIRAQDLENYGLKVTDESWALDPRPNGGTQRPGSPDGSLATETRKPGSLK